MGRRRKTPDYQLLKIRKKGNEHDNFFRVYRSLYEDQKFRSLHGTVKDVFFAIALQVGREDGHQLTCCLPESQYSKLGFTKKQFMVAVKELEERGFIKVDRYKSRKPNRYTLSDKWQK